MLRSFAVAIAAVLGSILSCPTSLCSWQESIEKFIERDSVAYVVIQEPSLIAEQIDSSVFFQNRYYERARELLIDGQFSLTTEERLVELENAWYELRDALAHVQEVSVIVHSWEYGYQMIPEVSIVFAGTSDANRDLVDVFSSIQSLSTGLGGRESDFLSGVVAEILPEVVVEETANYVIVSNCPNKAGELVTRIEGSASGRFHSLAENRSFQEVQSLLKKRADAPQLRGFVAPKHFELLMSELISQELWGTQPASLSGAGFQVLFQNRADAIKTPEGTYKPIINWDFVALYTQPASGYGKLIEAFAPLETLPVLPYKITSLSAEGFKPEKRHTAIKEILEQNEMEDYFGLLSGGLLGVGEEFDKQSVLGASNASIRVLHEELDMMFWGDGIRIERVNDLAAMKRLFMQKIKEANDNLGGAGQLAEVDCEHGQLFARSESAIREELEMFELEQFSESGLLVDQMISQEYEYFLNDEWMVCADHLSMRRFLKSVYEETAEPQAFDLLLEASCHASGQDSFYKITYQSKNLVDNSIEEERIWQSHYNVDDVDDEWNLPDESMSEQEYFEMLDELVNDWDDKEFDDAMDHVLPALESEPDEYGLRIALDSKENVAAAVKQLFFNAFRETFGTSISLYSKQTRGMHIFGQVFSFLE